MSPLARPVAARTEHADAAWEALNHLQGNWRATTDTGREIHVSYRLISRGSALVETFRTASGTETLSVYHRDGASLMLTHYCAQGNQARLKAAQSTQDHIVFEYLDATNLQAHQGVMKQLTFTLRENGFDTTSVYEEEGNLESTTLHFSPVAQAVP